MPKIDELIGGLGQVQLISTLDLMKGYRQVSVEPKSEHKPAFMTTSQQVSVYCNAFRTRGSSGRIPENDKLHLIRPIRVCLYRHG